jgi:hypothetical protein
MSEPGRAEHGTLDSFTTLIPGFACCPGGVTGDVSLGSLQGVISPLTDEEE